MSCGNCLKTFEGASFLNCNACKSSFCYVCLNISTDQVSKLNKKSLENIRCPSCCNISRRRRADDTLVPHHNQLISPTNGDKSDKSAQAVTLESMSLLFDEKLSPSSPAMLRLRESLREDFKQMMVSEINSTVQSLKEEFTHTTDFIVENQNALEAKLAVTEKDCEYLQHKNDSLNADILVLKSRLKSLEQVSRNLNVEIQAVPESRNENVFALFKTLCSSIGVQITDSDIRSCRRVAKMNSTSSRPRNIIVTLSSPRLRDTLLSAAHRFNKADPGNKLGTTQMGLTGEHCRIFITEHLSPECKQLHAAARSFARDNGFKYVWVKNGQIYLRRDDNSSAIRVKDLSSLTTIK